MRHKRGLQRQRHMFDRTIDLANRKHGEKENCRPSFRAPHAGPAADDESDDRKIPNSGHLNLLR